jgi:hypothetical protein
MSVQQNDLTKFPFFIYQTLSDEDRWGNRAKTYIRQKMERKLAKFSRSIERVSVRLKDINGPRGGRDKVCRIKIVFNGLPTVLIEERSHSTNAAVQRALTKAVRAANGLSGRRRQAPLRQFARKDRASLGAKN